jgi:hypothetical protein
MDGERMVDIDLVARLLDQKGSLRKAMREYKKGGAK